VPVIDAQAPPPPDRIRVLTSLSPSIAPPASRSVAAREALARGDLPGTARLAAALVARPDHAEALSCWPWRRPAGAIGPALAELAQAVALAPRANIARNWPGC
jgi:hypothetical protein